MSNSLIPSQTGLTLRRTDTLISLTNKLLANTGAKGIHEMTDDELWAWWLSLNDQWKWLFLGSGLKLELWQNHYEYFNGNYHYQKDFDWLNRELIFSYLKELQRLTELDLQKYQIQDISVIANLTQLTSLNLSNNLLQDPIELYINEEPHDISALANLTQLTQLNLSHNAILDISTLANLTQLTELDLSCNRIKDISALANLTQLTQLNLGLSSGKIFWTNRIQDITPLANLTQLRHLNLRDNPITPQDIEWLRQQLPNCEIDF